MVLREQRNTGNDMVSLYATRYQMRMHRSPATFRRSNSAYTGVMTFGRKATRRTIERSGSNRLVASVLAATAMLAGAGSTAAASTVHWVEPNETLNEIAQQYEKSPEQIAQLNSITDPNFILAGNLLMVEPGKNDGNHIGPRHHVESGDTLTSIAQRYGVTIDELALVNGVSNNDLIYAGDQLTIPIGIRPPGQWNHYADYAEVSFDMAVDEQPVAESTYYEPDSAPVVQPLPATPPVTQTQPAAPSTQQPVAPAPVTPAPVTPAPVDPAPVAPDPTPAPQENQSQDQGASFGLHLVVEGETLSGVAGRYGMSTSVLAEFNNISADEDLMSGRLLRIPLDYVSNGSNI